VLSTSVTSASITSLDVALYGLASQHVGPLQAMVAVNGALSQLAQVAVCSMPLPLSLATPQLLRVGLETGSRSTESILVPIRLL